MQVPYTRVLSAREENFPFSIQGVKSSRKMKNECTFIMFQRTTSSTLADKCHIVDVTLTLVKDLRSGS